MKRIKRLRHIFNKYSIFVLFLFVASAAVIYCAVDPDDSYAVSLATGVSVTFLALFLQEIFNSYNAIKKCYVLEGKYESYSYKEINDAESKDYYELEQNEGMVAEIKYLGGQRLQIDHKHFENGSLKENWVGEISMTTRISGEIVWKYLTSSGLGTKHLTVYRNSDDIQIHLFPTSYEIKFGREVLKRKGSF